MFGVIARVFRARARSMRSNPRGARPPPRSSRRRSGRPLTLTTAHLPSPPWRRGRALARLDDAPARLSKRLPPARPVAGVFGRSRLTLLTPHAYQHCGRTVLQCRSARIQLLAVESAYGRLLTSLRIHAGTSTHEGTRARLHTCDTCVVRARRVRERARTRRSAADVHVGCVGGGGRRAGAVAHASAIRAWRARARSPVVAGSARFRGETGAPRAAR